MEQLSKEWFELADRRKRLFARAVWIPVYGLLHPIREGEYPQIGHVEETLIVGSAVVEGEKRGKAEELDWHYWSQDNTTSYLSDEGEYQQADSFYDTAEGPLGFRLVLSQNYNSLHPRQVTIHQDFVHAYGLLEEGDFFVRPSEGYEQVVRLTKGEEGEVTFVEIRAEYLKDYLAARQSALRLYYFRQRQAIMPEDPAFDWPEDHSLVSEQHYRCEVRCDEIDSSGDFPGASWAMFKAWRTDVDPDEDVPDFSQDVEENTASESEEGVRGGKGLRYRVTGELWRGEWIEPSDNSCRIGHSEPDEVIMVTLDGGGAKVDLSTLKYEEVGKYLWFRPEVIPALLAQRGAKLTWYTGDTGGVSADPDWLLHFGVNQLGLVNAYAYDVARRPLWQRRIWAAHNTRPDGGVSHELMKAQMECNPASTKAPEEMPTHALDWLNHVFVKKFDAVLIRDHHEVESLLDGMHRFRATDETGLRALAKDLVKITIERINKKSILKALGEDKSDRGTLKLLEQLLATHTDETYSRARMAPLFGLYDLRGADAHLSGADTEECYAKLRIDRDQPYVLQAATMIANIANTFGVIGNDLKECAPDPA